MCSEIIFCIIHSQLLFHAEYYYFNNSRKSEEKYPPAGGFKTKVGNKASHYYHKPSDATIQQEPSGVCIEVRLPWRSQHDFDTVVQTTSSGLLAFSDAADRPGTNKILQP